MWTSAARSRFPTLRPGRSRSISAPAMLSPSPIHGRVQHEKTRDVEDLGDGPVPDLLDPSALPAFARSSSAHFMDNADLCRESDPPGFDPRESCQGLSRDVA